ncbi:MAG: ATP-binding cassette domain-containing protein [Deltaproteobacteria bacterium]|nr:ATP-binding cassette domain-containing protein [Nannocystaceae bacterium]
MIRASELHKRFGDKVAVEQVSFVAPDGKITGLLGPNGAGKTTTLRMVAAMIRPDRGHTEIDGFDTARDREQVLRRLGVLPDARGLYPRLSARENVRYYGRLHDLDGEALEREIDRLFGLLDMGELADRRVHGFSQGERAKVAIARALVHRPHNVMLDEPTNGLDVMSTRAMRELVRRLKADGCCVVFSSHVMQEVAALCDEIFVVARGKVVAHGSPDALREQTGKADLEDAFVAAIGSEEGLHR